MIKLILIPYNSIILGINDIGPFVISISTILSFNGFNNFVKDIIYRLIVHYMSFLNEIYNQIIIIIEFIHK